MAENKGLDAILEEEMRKLEEIAQGLDEVEEEPGVDLDSNLSKMDIFDLTEGQKKDLLKKISRLDVLSRERILMEMNIIAQSCVKQIVENTNVEVNSARLTALSDLRMKILGELKQSTSIDLEDKVKERTKAFVERGVHHLVELVSEDIARSWAGRMSGEGF